MGVFVGGLLVDGNRGRGDCVQDSSVSLTRVSLALFGKFDRSFGGALTNETFSEAEN